MSKLVIYGAGGLGREVKSMLGHCTQPFELIGFLDDGLPVGSTVHGMPVLGDIHWLANCPKDVQVILAVGNPKVKQSILNQIKPTWQISFATVQHNRALIQDAASVKVGVGVILSAGCILTTDIMVHDHVLINLNVTVGHDSVIGSCSSIMPNVSIAGEVTIGDAVMIGSGANIINRITIGAGAIVGAGSVVNHPIHEGATAAGVPARVIK